MTEFHYVAVDAASQTIEGRMDAASKSAVVERLHAAGHVPIRIEEIGLLALQNMDVTELFRGRRVTRRSLALITSQLATLLHAGLALDESLGILADLIERPRERQALLTLREKISGGATLADAMAAQPKVFPGFYVSMVRAGEAGASLEAVLSRLAEFLERSEAAKEHVKSALMYPAIVAVTCCLSIAVLLMFVVPRFRPLFEQAGPALPTAARLLLAVSDFVDAYWWAGILIPVLIALLIVAQFKRPASRAQWERLFLKLPLVGELIAKVEVVRFSRTLGTLLKNGVSLLAALAITRETISNQVFVGAVNHVLEQVKTGKGLAGPLAQTKVFPALAIHLIRVGEESGRQEEMLFKISEIFETETRRSIDRMLALLGPVITVVLGLVVAGVIGSILTAILSVYDLAM